MKNRRVCAARAVPTGVHAKSRRRDRADTCSDCSATEKTRESTFELTMLREEQGTKSKPPRAREPQETESWTDLKAEPCAMASRRTKWREISECQMRASRKRWCSPDVRGLRTPATRGMTEREFG